MVIREMTEDECRQALTQLGVGRLACARDNQPYVVPIAFAFDGQHLYGFSTPGRKIDWMRANPRVCVEVDELTSRDTWMSVVVFGRYEELSDTPDTAGVRARAQQILQQRATWWEYTAIPGAEWRRKAGPFTPVYYRIHVDSLSGHRAVPASRT